MDPKEARGVLSEKSQQRKGCFRSRKTQQVKQASKTRRMTRMVMKEILYQGQGCLVGEIEEDGVASKAVRRAWIVEVDWAIVSMVLVWMVNLG